MKKLLLVLAVAGVFTACSDEKKPAEETKTAEPAVTAPAAPAVEATVAAVDTIAKAVVDTLKK